MTSSIEKWLVYATIRYAHESTREVRFPTCESTYNFEYLHRQGSLVVQGLDCLAATMGILWAVNNAFINSGVEHPGSMTSLIGHPKLPDIKADLQAFAHALRRSKTGDLEILYGTLLLMLIRTALHSTLRISHPGSTLPRFIVPQRIWL